MKYYSSRDLNQVEYTFTEILLKGLAEDGGLFVPETYPSINKEELETLSEKSYADLAYYILSLFVGESIESLKV